MLPPNTNLVLDCSLRDISTIHYFLEDGAACFVDMAEFRDAIELEKSSPLVLKKNVERVWLSRVECQTDLQTELSE